MIQLTTPDGHPLVLFGSKIDAVRKYQGPYHAAGAMILVGSHELSVRETIGDVLELMRLDIASDCTEKILVASELRHTFNINDRGKLAWGERQPAQNLE